MRYLKKFESLTYKEIISDIKDILLPISDLGYNIDVELIKDDTYSIFIKVINVYNDDKPLLFTDEIEDEFNRMIEFINKNGFEMYKVTFLRSYGDRSPVNKHIRDELFIYEYFIDYIKGKKLIDLSFELIQKSK